MNEKKNKKIQTMLAVSVLTVSTVFSPLTAETVHGASTKVDAPPTGVYTTNHQLGNVSKQSNVSDFVFDATTGVIKAYKGNDSIVEIPSEIDGVKVISVGLSKEIQNLSYYEPVCDNNTTMTKLIIPEGVKYVGGSAFTRCSALKEIVFPSTLEGIEQSAFYHCTSLTSITLPENLKRIDKLAFAECSKLSSVTFKGTETAINYSSFWDTPWYNSLSEKNNEFFVVNNVLLKYNGNSANVTVPSNIIGIGAEAFDGNRSVESITLPDSIKTIGERAFRNASKLKTINIPKGIKKIEEDTFRGTALSSITLPNTVTEIESNAFTECYNLSNVTIPDSVTYIHGNVFKETPWISGKKDDKGFVIVNKILIDYKGNSGKVVVPGDKVKSVIGAFGNLDPYNKDKVSISEIEFTDGVEVIGDDACKYQESLSKVSMADSVKVIGTQAFYGNVGLSQLDLSNELDSIQRGAFAEDKNIKTVNISAKSIAVQAFTNCEQLKTVTFTERVEYIQTNAFSGCAFTEVYLPNANVKLDKEAFPGTVKVTIGNKGSSKPSTTKTPEASATPSITETPEASDAPSITETPKVSGTPSITKTPEASATPSITETPEASDAPSITETPEVSGTPSITETPEVLGTPSIVSTPAPTNLTTPKPVITETPKPVITETPKETNIPDATPQPNKEEYCITYQLNGGINNVKNPEKYSEKDIVVLSNPKKKGYSFSGWYLDEKYESKIIMIDGEIKQDIVLYAKWKKVTKPSRPTIYSIKNSKSKQMTVKLNKISDATGYEMIYATNKKFTKGKKVVRFTGSSKTIKKLKKGMKYYVKIRAYKIDSTGRRVYGGYCTNYKVVKIKK